MSRNVYKYCFVPKCKNTTVSAANKVFFNVPNGPVRKKWFKICRRDPTSLVSHLYICEDHFNVEEDVQNWTRHKIAKEANINFRYALKPNVLPSRFDCQTDRKMAHSTPINRSLVLKRTKANLIKDLLEAGPSTSSDSMEITQEADMIEEEPDFDLDKYIEEIDDADPMVEQLMVEENHEYLIQDDPMVEQLMVEEHHEYVIESDPMVEEAPIQLIDRACSPIPITTCNAICQAKPKTLNKRNQSRPNVKSCETQTVVNLKLQISRGTTTADLKYKKGGSIFSSSSDASSFPDTSHQLDQSFNTADLSDDTSEESERVVQSSNVTNNIKMIESKPRLYLGLGKESLYLLELLMKGCKCPKTNILIGLMKIRLNDSMERIGDTFDLSRSSVSRIIKTVVPKMSILLRLYVWWPKKDVIKRNLPIAFRANFSNVQSIIDCFEVEIEKPSDPTKQALTWSDYKKCNTIKYLISCTPDGFINFISKGYGGRTSDAVIVKDCKYLEHLTPNTCVMADRGFKTLDMELTKIQCTLVRPPSVSKGQKLTENEVRLAKRVASLRVHIERVIGRIREYKFLSPHSRFNHELMDIIDSVVLIACALTNCQGPLIL